MKVFQFVCWLITAYALGATSAFIFMTIYESLEARGWKKHARSR